LKTLIVLPITKEATAYSLSAPGCNTAHPAQGQRQIRQEAHVQKIWCYEVKRVSCTHAKLCMLASGETQYWTKKKQKNSCLFSSFSLPTGKICYTK